MRGFSATAAVLAMARKDLTLLFRNRGALFFTFGWPVIMALADLAATPEGPRRQPTRRFLGELRTFLRQPQEAKVAGGSTGPAIGGWKPVAIEKRALSTERRGPANAFEVTFPQGMLWGVISCALGFAVSLVSERTRGTLMRLQTAPVSRAHVLAGKAVACLGAIAAVLGLLLALGWAFFGVRPGSWALLAVAGGSLAACFVGIMMVVAVLGKTEQSAGGLGWAIMMPLTLLGGGMVPLFAMPRWMQAAGSVSPVKWGILALEGAIWRGFGPAEMLLPCGVLLAVGTVGFLLGARLFAAEG
jgi:ABC-2 type transport system permease protein